MYLDLVALLVVILFGALGLISGLLIQVLRLVAAAIAVFAALHYHTLAMDAWPSFFAEVPYMRSAVFSAGIFCVVYLVLSVVVKVIVVLFRKSDKSLSVLDRVLGGVAGVGKGAIICYFLMALLFNVKERLGKEIPGIDLENSKLADFVKKYQVSDVKKDIQVLIEPLIKEASSGIQDDSPR